MSGGSGNDREKAPTEFAARLHDASAGLAVGISLLKGSTSSGGPASGQTIEVFEEVLANLKQLSRGTPARGPQTRPRENLRESLKHEAKLVGVDLDLEVIGLAGWLTPDQGELLYLAGREAIRNVKRHAGAASCRMTVDLSACPFVLWARDWAQASNLGPGWATAS